MLRPAKCLLGLDVNMDGVDEVDTGRVHAGTNYEWEGEGGGEGEGEGRGRGLQLYKDTQFKCHMGVVNAHTYTHTHR